MVTLCRYNQEVETSCDDGLDNDCNGLSDMDDPACHGGGGSGDTAGSPGQLLAIPSVPASGDSTSPSPSGLSPSPSVNDNSEAFASSAPPPSTSPKPSTPLRVSPSPKAGKHKAKSGARRLLRSH